MPEPAGVKTLTQIQTETRDLLMSRLPYFYSRCADFAAAGLTVPDAIEPYKLMDGIAYAFADVRRQLDLMIYTRSIENAWDFALDVIAENVGIKRKTNETDTWLRERVKFAVFFEHQKGELGEVRKALAWFSGIQQQNLNWSNDYLPSFKGHLNKNPAWPYQNISGVGKELAAYMQINIPWQMIDVWGGDQMQFIGDPAGAFPWQSEAATGSRVVHGHHLILDLMDLADILSMSGVKVRLWGEGTDLIGDPNGAFPWQTNIFADGRVSGPIEIRGPDGIHNHYTEPEGMLAINENDNPVNAMNCIPSNDIFHRDSGKRIFTYGSGANNGGRLWP